ncbi:L-glyceraldehyde 3-phosphate reductase [Plantibacter flavus]|uniref:L-glyceraldehyde 3-phosphate reductase n=2 Tax=Plantibacter flavus TaxID=150123 RepID=A0A3N2C7W4_9MICO|nr:L-glyceraldehyde 3-phosphate reductase [Plantibacter flavus]SMG25136.1 L-glyceraldehyde 3-phosphate reductase [Plantibacter flavus]
MKAQTMPYEAAETRYDDMTYRRVGRSGLRLPALSLGLWHNFGEGRSIEVQRAIVRRAFDLGITHFDLANNYGPPAGSAETAFGRIFAEDLAAHRDEIIITSKAGYYMWQGPYGEWGSRKTMLSSLDQSLARIGVEYVDVFYSHRPDPETPIEETMGALATAVKQGKALYAGISNYSPEQTIAAAAALREHGVPLLVHQPRYSMFSREVEDGLLDTLDDLGLGAVVFSPLAQGMLTDRYLGGTVPSDSRAATSHFLNEESITDTYLERARGLQSIAEGRGQTLAQLALSWVLRRDTVTSAIIGASSVEQLEGNYAAIHSLDFDDAELARIDEFAVHGTLR